MKVILFPHTHWDREWYKPFQDFRIRLTEVMVVILEELKNGNLKHFYLDGQTVILEDYLELHPEKADEIRELITAKKLFIGPWYVLADEFLVTGESLIRNLLIGTNQAKSFGCEDFFGYLPDSFGHNSEIPKILVSFGIKNAVLWRGSGDRKSEFIWKSNDNSSVIATYLTEGYFQDILHTGGNIEKLTLLLDKIKASSTSDKLLLPVGGDHLGAVTGLNGMVENLNKESSDYEFEQTTISEYFKGLNQDGLEEIQNELRDNSKNPILPGVFSTRLYLKQLNAVSTWKLSRIAEPLQAFLQAADITKNKKNELDYAWKLLLKNHPHDSICGCSVDEVHEENVSRFKQVNQISEAIIDRCLNDVSKTFPDKTLFACNLGNHKFSGVATIKTHIKHPERQLVRTFTAFPREILLDTQRVPFCEDIKEFYEYLVYVEDIPAFSINSLPVKQCPHPVKLTATKISNSLVEIQVNPDGTIDLRELKDNKIFKNLHIIQDRQDAGDTYNYAPVVGDKPVKAEFVSSEIAEKGDLRSILKVVYKLKETLITTEIIVTAASKRVEFVTSWVNTEENHILQVKYNLPEKITETVSENTFGLIKREFEPDYRIENHIPAEKGQELKTNSAPMQRFVFSQGLGLLTEGLPEYVVSENSLLITLLRATGKLSKTSLNTRNFPAGPPLETPDAQCLGAHSVRYAICTTQRPQELFKEADEFMGNLILDEGASCNKNNPQNLINISNKNILVYAAKTPENSAIKGIILRCLNISETPQTTKFKSNINFSSFLEVNSLEEAISPDLNIKQEIIFQANELKSLLFLKRSY